MPTAAAKASASRVDAGSAEILALTSSSSVSGTGKRLQRVGVRRETRASSSAKNGFPPDRSWIRSSVWRGNDVPSRSRRKRWSAPALSGPTTSRRTRVRTRRAFELRRMRALGRPPRQQEADRARVEPPQGERERARRGRVEPLNVVDGDQDRCAFAQELQRVAHCDRERAAIDRIARRLLSEQRHLERAPPRRRAAQAATSSTTPSSRSASPTWPRACSASAGRDDRTVSPCARACSTPASQSVDLPIPASPSSTSAAGPRLRLVDKGLEGAELVLPANDLDGRPPRNNVAVTTGKARLDLPAPDLLEHRSDG